MEFREHGGGCCGIAHIYGFGNTPVGDGPAVGRRGGIGTLADLDARLLQFSNPDAAYPRKGLVEVSLTDQQMVGWAAPLKERGFRLVTRFLNSNSDNHVNVLHKTFGNTRGANRPARPFQW